MTTVPTCPRRSSRACPVRKCFPGTSSNKATVSWIWISAFLPSDYKAGCQSRKVFSVAQNPRAQNGGRALGGRERKAQHINLAEAVVAAMLRVLGGGGGLLERRTQHVRVGQRDAERRLEDQIGR